MPNLPPPILDRYFDDLDKPIDQAVAIMTPVIKDFMAYLNELPCLSNLQLQRYLTGRVSRRQRSPFKLINQPPKKDSRHWYFYNTGGRNEMQFNIGMYSTQCITPSVPYVRIGVGFNFSRGQFGRPDDVQREFCGFARKVMDQQRRFLTFFDQSNLEVEFSSNDAGSSGVSAHHFMDWLASQTSTRANRHIDDWVFIGRLLRRGTDQATLERPQLLDQTLDAVFSGFIEYY